jgi:hypothetical protein
MNATLFEGGKVHRLSEEAARCGVGKPPRRSEWQVEFGEVTCRRCRKLVTLDQRNRQPRETRGPGGLEKAVQTTRKGNHR